MKTNNKKKIAVPQTKRKGEVVRLRVFERVVTLRANAEYSTNDDGSLTLCRWRVFPDDAAPSAWIPRNAGKNGGWPSKIPANKVPGGAS